jgi:hypothetical protein
MDPGSSKCEAMEATVHGLGNPNNVVSVRQIVQPVAGPKPTGCIHRQEWVAGDLQVVCSCNKILSLGKAISGVVIPTIELDQSSAFESGAVAWLGIPERAPSLISLPAGEFPLRNSDLRSQGRFVPENGKF